MRLILRRVPDSADLSLMQALLDHERAKVRHVEAERDAWQAKALRAARQRDVALRRASEVAARAVNGSYR